MFLSLFVVATAADGAVWRWIGPHGGINYSGYPSGRQAQQIDLDGQASSFLPMPSVSEPAPATGGMEEDRATARLYAEAARRCRKIFSNDARYAHRNEAGYGDRTMVAAVSCRP